jgi:hypothetical protein
VPKKRWLGFDEEKREQKQDGHNPARTERKYSEPFFKQDFVISLHYY